MVCEVDWLIHRSQASKRNMGQLRETREEKTELCLKIHECNLQVQIGSYSQAISSLQDKVKRGSRLIKCQLSKTDFYYNYHTCSITKSHVISAFLRLHLTAQVKYTHTHTQLILACMCMPG